MNPKDRNKYIAIGVIIVLAIGLFAYQITRPMELPQMPEGYERPATTATPAARPAGTPAGTPAVSAFVQMEVDIDQLVANVQEVDFNYSTEQLQRNPMTPLVGALRARVGEEGRIDPGGPVTPALSIARNMVITGIVHDTAEPMAVLENREDQQVSVVTVGHEFPVGIVVESIEESRVVLRVGDMRIEKPLEEQLQ